jgi:hypothetical protein
MNFSFFFLEYDKDEENGRGEDEGAYTKKKGMTGYVGLFTTYLNKNDIKQHSCYSVAVCVNAANAYVGNGT